MGRLTSFGRSARPRRILFLQLTILLIASLLPTTVAQAVDKAYSVSLLDQSPICAPDNSTVVLDFRFTNEGTQEAGAFRLEFSGLSVVSSQVLATSNGKNWTGATAGNSIAGAFGDDTGNPRLPNGGYVDIRVTATVTGGTTVATDGSVANDFNPRAFAKGNQLTLVGAEPVVYTDCSINITAPSPILAGFPASFSATIVDGNGNTVTAQDSPTDPADISFSITSGSCTILGSPITVPAPGGQTGSFFITFLDGSGTGTCTLTGTTSYQGGGSATGSVVIDVEGNAEACTGVGCSVTDADATSTCIADCGTETNPEILFVDQQTSPGNFCGGAACEDYYVTGIDTADGLIDVTLHITGLRRSEINVYSWGDKVTQEIVELSSCTPPNGPPCILSIDSITPREHIVVVRLEGDPPVGYR